MSSVKVAAQAMQSEVASLAVHDHPCLLYKNADELATAFVPYLQAGLMCGERCVYFVTDSLPEYILECMRSNGFELAPFIESGAFLIIHTNDAHLKEGFFGEDKMRAYWSQSIADARRKGFKALRAVVEMTWALSGKPGCNILAPYESRLNTLLDAEDVTVLCMYDRTRFNAEMTKAVVAAHPLVVARHEVLENLAYVRPHKFNEYSHELELEATLDNLTLIKRLQTASRTLEHAYEELEHLTYIISHELQEPLATIRSYQNLLSVRYQDRLGPDADSFIAECTKASTTVGRMIDDLWTYARIEKGADHFGDFDAGAALSTAMDALIPCIEETRAQISFDTLPRVYGVQGQIADVFKQLLHNAMKFSNGARPSIHVSSQRKGLMWEFSVADNGPGIDSGHRREVFRVFYRIGGRPGDQGTGMGLSICRRIIEHHSGKIWIDGKQSIGARVIFSLPAIETSKLPFQANAARNRSAS
jgi:signal transduction histidine kinase